MKYTDPVVAVSLSVASFVIYVRTLAPTLLFGDSAELQTIAYTLGIGHPTGYPVYVLLAKLFTFIPAGDVAYRVNLFSAFCAALTVAIVYLILRKLGGTYIAAVCGAATLALTPLFWKHASIAEIYTASAMFLAVILLAVLIWRETNNPRWLFVAGLSGGLSLGIHTTVALSAVAVVIYLTLSFVFPLSSIKERRKHALSRAEATKDILSGLYGALLGVFLFLSSFLFLGSLNSPAGYYNTVVRPSLSVWDMTPADFDSPFERLAFLYFPPQFKEQFFNVPLDEVTSRLKDFASDVSWQLAFALAGLISLFISRKDSGSRWREATLLLVAFVTFLAFAATYNVYDYYVYYIPALLVLAVFVGLGVNAILEAVTLIPKLPNYAPTMLGILLLGIGLYSSRADIATHWNERIPPALEDWESYLYQFPDARRLESEKIVSRLEDNAIIFTDWDHAYDFYYVAHVMQGRIEMDFHETFPQDGVTQLADSTIEYIEANLDSRPIYFTERPSYLATQYKILPAGSGLYQIKRK